MVALSSEQAALRDPLEGVPAEARTLLCQGFIRALDPVVWVWEQTPAGARHPLPPRVLDRFGERFNDAALPRQSMEHMRRVWRIEITLAADLLEAQILDGANDAYTPLLTACCTRIGQIYNEIKRRCGLLFALLTLRWELRLLGYRGSPAVAPLLPAPAIKTPKGGTVAPEGRWPPSPPTRTPPAAMAGICCLLGEESNLENSWRIWRDLTGFDGI